jgi:Flp pilus assembly protein TadD
VVGEAHEVQEALEAGHRAIARATGRPDAHHYLGLILESAGDVDGAVKAHGAALALNPRHEAARERLAQLEQRQQEQGTRLRE